LSTSQESRHDVPDEIELDINGQREIIAVEPDTPFLQVLRNDLGLTAAKYGCGLEQCFACAVLVDGRATTTCASAVDAFVGRRVVTLEGLASAGRLHPVQQAFIDEEAAQCGYCIPGMIMGAVALLERTPNPSDGEIREALDPHLCRCGSHWRIIKAVRRAARERS
jgi:nicotinate dehydrogenase subunit A